MCGQLTLGIKKIFLASGLVGVGIHICCDCSCEEQMVMGVTTMCQRRHAMMSMKEMKTRPFVISSSDE